MPRKKTNKQEKSTSAAERSKKVSIHRQFDDEALLKGIFTYIADEIMVIGKNGNILFVNDAAVKALGYTRKFILSQKFTRFLKNKMSLRRWKEGIFDEIKKNKRSISLQLNRVTKSKEVQVLDVTASFFPFRNEEYIITCSKNVTKQIAMQKKLRDSEVTLHEQEKRKAVQHFIAGLAHEIQYPLKGIYDRSLRLIAKYHDRDFEYIGYKEFKDILKSLETMSNQIRYCSETIRRLDTLHRKRARVETTAGNDLNEIIRDVIRLMKSQLMMADIEIQLKLRKNVPLVQVDAIELLQIVNNILTNSMQSIRGSGFIELKTAYRKEDDQVLLQIRDNGVGIPKDNLPHIFDPFFTTKNRGIEKSSGLGLAIVYSIVKEAKGDIEVRSSLRHGTSFSISFPVAHKNEQK